MFILLKKKKEGNIWLSSSVSYLFPTFSPLILSTLITPPPPFLFGKSLLPSSLSFIQPSVAFGVSLRMPVFGSRTPPRSFHTVLMLTGCSVFCLLTVPKQSKRANLCFFMADLSFNSSPGSAPAVRSKNLINLKSSSPWSASVWHAHSCNHLFVEDNYFWFIL